MRTLSNIRKRTCRICCCEDSPIFLNLTIHENEELREMFNDLFPFIKIEKSSKTPTRICLICTTVTHDFHNIWKKCRSVQDQLNGRVGDTLESQNDGKDVNIIVDKPSAETCTSTLRSTRIENPIIFDGPQPATDLVSKKSSAIVEDSSKASDSITNKRQSNIPCSTNRPSVIVPAERLSRTEVTNSKILNRQNTSVPNGVDSDKKNNRNGTNIAFNEVNPLSSTRQGVKKTDNLNHENVSKTSTNNSGKRFNNDQQQIEIEIETEKEPVEIKSCIISNNAKDHDHQNIVKNPASILKKKGDSNHPEQLEVEKEQVPISRRSSNLEKFEQIPFGERSNNREKLGHQNLQNIPKAPSTSLKEGAEEDRKQSGPMVTQVNKEPKHSCKLQSSSLPEVSIEKLGCTAPPTIVTEIEKKNELASKKSEEFRNKNKGITRRTPTTLKNSAEKKSPFAALGEKKNRLNPAAKIANAPASGSILLSLAIKESARQLNLQETGKSDNTTRTAFAMNTSVEKKSQFVALGEKSDRLNPAAKIANVPADGSITLASSVKESVRKLNLRETGKSENTTRTTSTIKNPAERKSQFVALGEKSDHLNPAAKIANVPADGSITLSVKESARKLNLRETGKSENTTRTASTMKNLAGKESQFVALGEKSDHLNPAAKIVNVPADGSITLASSVKDSARQLNLQETGKSENTTRTASTMKNSADKKSQFVALEEKSDRLKTAAKIANAPANGSITSAPSIKENEQKSSPRETGKVDDLWQEYNLPGKDSKLYQCRKCNAMLLKESAKDFHLCSSSPQVSLKRCQQDKDQKTDECDRISIANKKIKVRTDAEVSNRG